MRTSFRRTIIATTALIGLSSFAASAATPAATTPATAMQTSSRHRMAGKVEDRINDLHAKLKITAEQQKPWDDFTLVMRENATRMDETFQRRVQMMSGMTADQSMASYAQMAEQHAQDVQKLLPVFQALYASMSDGQKKIADNVFRAEAHNGEPAKHR
jgi:protein CpxP